MKGGKMEPTIEETYDNRSWNKYSCGSEYFNNSYNSNKKTQTNHLRTEKISMEKRIIKTAALSLESEFAVAVGKY